MIEVSAGRILNNSILKNDFFYSIRLASIIDAFWLLEDILELDADADCEFSDDYTCLSILKTDLSSVEIEIIFKLYRVKFTKLK